MALNQAAVNVEVVNGQANQSLVKALTATAITSTASFIRGLQAIKSVTSTSTISIIKSIGKVLAIASSNTVSIVKA